MKQLTDEVRDAIRIAFNLGQTYWRQADSESVKQQNKSITREDVIRMAKESGFKACVGTTDKEGNYHPFVNAFGKDIPIEWLERFAALAALDTAQQEPYGYHSPKTGKVYASTEAASMAMAGEVKTVYL